MGNEFALRRYRPADRERVEAVMESALRDVGVHFEEAPPDADGTLTEEHLDSGGEFNRMHVAPDYQRRGYGQRILDELQRRARDRGHAALVLNTSSLQSAVLCFYRRSRPKCLGACPRG